VPWACAVLAALIFYAPEISIYDRQQYTSKGQHEQFLFSQLLTHVTRETVESDA
jgi:hypothetical protein